MSTIVSGQRQLEFPFTVDGMIGGCGRVRVGGWTSSFQLASSTRKGLCAGGVLRRYRYLVRVRGVLVVRSSLRRSVP